MTVWTVNVHTPAGGVEQLTGPMDYSTARDSMLQLLRDHPEYHTPGIGHVMVEPVKRHEETT